MLWRRRTSQAPGSAHDMAARAAVTAMAVLSSLQEARRWAISENMTTESLWEMCSGGLCEVTRKASFSPICHASRRLTAVLEQSRWAVRISIQHPSGRLDDAIGRQDGIGDWRRNGDRRGVRGGAGSGGVPR